MSDKLNFKHLITFNLRVTTREWSVDMTRVLDIQSLLEGSLKSYFQSNVSSGLGRASPVHPQIADAQGCRVCVLTNGEDKQSPALNSSSLFIQCPHSQQREKEN